MNYSRQNNISLAVQFFNLKKEYRDMKIKFQKDKMQCWFTISPTPLSKVYNIYMICKEFKSPKVFLYGNNILKIESDKFPHYYERNIKDKKVELCLYYGREWNKSKLISETIIPWTVEWLAHYEIWLVTGKWTGGGRHPNLKNNKKTRIETESNN